MNTLTKAQRAEFFKRKQSAETTQESNTKRKRLALKARQQQEKGGAPTTLEDGTRINGKGDVIVEQNQSKHKNRVHRKSVEGLPRLRAEIVKEENGFKAFRSMMNIKLPAVYGKLKAAMLSQEMYNCIVGKDTTSFQKEKMPCGDDQEEIDQVKTRGTYYFHSNTPNTAKVYETASQYYDQNAGLQRQVSKDDFLLYVIVAAEMILEQCSANVQDLFGAKQFIFDQVALPHEIWTVIVKNVITAVTPHGYQIHFTKKFFSLHGRPFDLYQTFSYGDLMHVERDDASVKVTTTTEKPLAIKIPVSEVNHVNIVQMLIESDNILKKIMDNYPQGFGLFRGLQWFMCAMNVLMNKHSSFVHMQNIHGHFRATMLIWKDVYLKKKDKYLFCCNTTKDAWVYTRAPNTVQVLRAVEMALRNAYDPGGSLSAWAWVGKYIHPKPWDLA